MVTPSITKNGEDIPLSNATKPSNRDKLNLRLDPVSSRISLGAHV